MKEWILALILGLSFMICLYLLIIWIKRESKKLGKKKK